MRTRATLDGGVGGEEDGWRGARIGAETRDRARRAMLQVHADIDIGEPDPPRVTIVFLVVTIVATIIEFASFGATPSVSELSQAGGAGIGVVATGAWWKLLVSNVLHGSIPHLLMNAFIIYLTGRWLEHLAGRAIVLATIGWSAVLAGIGSLLVDTPAVAIGASGVAFGLLGCAVAIDPRARTAIGTVARQLVVVNVVVTFLIPGISIGGHLGGLAAGLLVGFACWSRTPSDEHPAGRHRRLVPSAAIAAALVPIALLAIGPRALPDEATDARAATTAWLLERQLSGRTLSGGLEIDDASCEPAGDASAGDASAADRTLSYDCRIDDERSVVTFTDRDDQWGLNRLG